MTKENEVISLRGNKELWTKFVNKVREERLQTKKSVWDIIEIWIKAHLEK